MFKNDCCVTVKRYTLLTEKKIWLNMLCFILMNILNFDNHRKNFWNKKSMTKNSVFC